MVYVNEATLQYHFFINHCIISLEQKRQADHKLGANIVSHVELSV